MQTITPTLLAAARSLAGVPGVRATFHATRRGWTSLWQDVAATPTAVAAVYADDALWRFRVDGAGAVLCQIVDDPTDADQWAAWTTLNSDGAAGSDIAAAYDSPHFRVVYRNPAGAVRVIESADGATWSAPETLATPSGPLWLAAVGQDVLLLGTELDLYQRGYASGGWAGPYRLPGGPWTLPYGVAAADGAAAGDDPDVCRVLYAVDQRLRAVVLHRSTHTWGAPRCLAPGADQSVPDDASPRYPSIVAVGEGYAATWLESASGTPGWSQPIVRWSRDGEHWGLEAPLRVEATGAARLALAWDGATSGLIAGHDAAALSCDVRAPDDADERIGPLDVARYRYRATPDGARLELSFNDPEGACYPLSAAALAPLNQVRLWRGYVTSEGREELALPPGYLVRASRSEGALGGVVTVVAVDALGLLARRWPGEAAVYTDRSLAWLLAEVAALAGLAFDDDGDAAFARVLSSFVVYPNRPLPAALRDLLRLAGAVARVESDGVLRAHVLAGHTAEAVPTLGELGEILAAGYGPALADETGVVLSSAETAVRAEDVDLGMALGWRALRGLVDARAETAALAAQAAAYELARLSLDGRADHVTVSLRPEIELWDQVDVYAPAAAVPAETRRRTVVAIEETWEAGKGTFVSIVTLG